MSLGNVLFLVFVLAGVMTTVGYVHYRRTQAHMRDQVSGGERYKEPLDAKSVVLPISVQSKAVSISSGLCNIEIFSVSMPAIVEAG